jgi:hypothetical protein
MLKLTDYVKIEKYKLKINMNNLINIFKMNNKVRKEEKNIE